MAVPRTTLAWAIFLSVFAAFAWATYYVFVLWVTPGTAPSAILAYPFVTGGLAYAALAFGTGHGREFVALWSDPKAYVRIGLLCAMQIFVLAATYLAGPVDSALLSLIGDVVMTPLLIALFFAVYRAQVATPLFAVGLIVSLAGGTMAIVAGQSLSAVMGWGWLAVPGVPLTVAAYFILTARANRTIDASAVVGQSMLAAGVVFLAAAPLFPGGWSGLVDIRPVPALWLALCGLTSFFLAPALYFLALREVGLVIPPMLMTGIPVFTLVLSSLVLGIAIPLLGVLGIPVAVLGGVLALRAQSGADPEPPPGAGAAAP